MSRFPDRARSRAILIGASRFSCADQLPDILAVDNNIRALCDALTKRPTGTFAAENCRTIERPTTRLVGQEISAAVHQATDVLFIYYAGHGLVDDSGQLHLAMYDTDPKSIRTSSLPFDILRKEIEERRPDACVLILDCCFSGRTIGAMTTAPNIVAGQIDIEGTYVITSSEADKISRAPIGETYTAFTGSMLAAIHSGRQLTLDQLYLETDRNLRSRGFPLAQRRVIDRTGRLNLFKPSIPLKYPRVADQALSVGTATPRHGSTGDPAPGAASISDWVAQPATETTASVKIGWRPPSGGFEALPTAPSIPPRREQNNKRVHTRRAFAITAVGTLAFVAGNAVLAETLFRNKSNSSTAPTAHPFPPRTVAEARTQNPQFTGRNIAIVDVSGESERYAPGAPIISRPVSSPNLAIFLKSSPPQMFLEGLGFASPASLNRTGSEGTTRKIDDSSWDAIPIGAGVGLTGMTSGFLLVTRSDTDAGGGSTKGLPTLITDHGADLIILDDRIVVDAIRNWSDHSEGILLDKLVPILHQKVE